MMRRASTIALCLLVMLVSACALQMSPTPATGASGDRGPARIGFAGMAFEKAIYQPLIEAFNAANPDLQVEYVPLEPAFDGAPEDLARQVASAADTFTSILAGPDAAGLGVAADLRPLIDADSAFDRADFESGALLTSGPIHVLPSHLNVQTFGYNRDLLDRAGVTLPATGTTWGELLALAEQLAARRGDEVLVYGLDDGQDGRLALLGLLTEAGVPLTRGPDGALDLDRPEVVAALARVADLLERGVLYQRPQGDGPVTFEAMGAHLRDGRTALWLGGSAMLVGPGGGELAFAVGEAAVPALPRDQVLSSRGYMLSAGSANPAAAWRWLSYLSRQQPAASEGLFFFGLGVEVPARRSLAAQASFWEGLAPDRAEAVRVTLDRVAGLPAASDGLVRDNLGAALSDVQAGIPAAQALAEHNANLAEQLAAQATQAVEERDPIQVRLPEPVVVPAGATPITFATLGEEMGALRELARRFNAEGRGVYVTVESPSFNGDFSLRALAEQYDCLAWPLPPDPEEREALLDLRPLSDADASFDLGDYPVGLLAPYSDGSALYGLPYAVQLRALSYNRGAFADAGLAPPGGDWDLAELLEAARLLTAKADQRYGYAVEGLHTNDLLVFLAWQGALPVIDGKPRFTDGRVVQAIASYLELLRDYSPHTRLQGYSASRVIDAAAMALAQEGRVGMWHSGGFGSEMVIVRAGPGQSERPDIAIAPLALRPGSLGAGVSSSGLHISADSASPAACWEWLKFLSAQAEGLGERFPARASVATSEAFLAQARPGTAAVYAAYAEALAAPVATEDPLTGMDLFWLMRAADRALQGGDLERELAEAQTLTEQYLACVVGGDDPASCAMAVDTTYDGIGPR